MSNHINLFFRLAIEAANVTDSESPASLRIGEMVYELMVETQRLLFDGKCFILIVNEVLEPDMPFCCLLYLVDDFIGENGLRIIKLVL